MEEHALEDIEGLQASPQQSVYELALKILETHFDAEVVDEEETPDGVVKAEE